MIDEALLENTCKEVDALDAAVLNTAMTELGRAQPELLACVMATCEELSPDAAELGVYVFFVVYRAFERAAGAKLDMVSQRQILAAEERNDAVLAALGEADAEFLRRVEDADFSDQPVVVEFIVDVLAEEAEAGLSNEEQWLLFDMLNTVVEVLDDLSAEVVKC